jgi:hypothetical protein
VGVWLSCSAISHRDGLFCLMMMMTGRKVEVKSEEFFRAAAQANRSRDIKNLPH